MRRRGSAYSGGLIAFCLLLMLAVSAAFLKTRSYDFGWHLKTGELIRERFDVPRADEFSFTSHGVPWADHEWLFQVVASLLFSSLGHSGLMVLKALCALGVGAAGMASMRRTGASASAALVVVSLALFGLRSRLAERPESASLLLAAAMALILLDLSRGSGRPAGRLAAAGVLSVIWANAHASALLGPVLAVALSAGAGLDALLSLAREDRVAGLRGARWCLLSAAVTAAGLLINPYGSDLLAIPLRIAGALASPNLTNPEWLPPSLSSAPLFFAVVGAMIPLVLGRLLLRRASAARSAALVTVTVLLGMSSIRHVGLFFALLPAMAAGMIGGRSGIGWPLKTGALAAMSVSVAMLFRPPDGARLGIGLQDERFPVGAARFLEARMNDARAYNDTAFGGYLIWQGWPERRVFLDGRNEVHAELLRSLAAALDDGRQWSALMDLHEVEAAILSFRKERITVRDAVTGAVSESTFAEAHFPRNAWALVYWDDLAMIYVRREGRYTALAADLEYRHIRPEAASFGYLPDPSAEGADGVAADIRRKLGEDPNCPLARRLATVYGSDPL